MDSRIVLSGRYELRDRLGQGGMSVVWQARDLTLNRDVAVKMLAARECGRRPGGIQFEALAAAKLVHPHVARVFDYGEAELQPGQRTPFVVMELLQGTPLSEATTPMPPRQAFQICAEIASGLAAAHAHGVVHCDVKPGNVMLTPVGAKVFDFGIASMVAGIDDDRTDDEVVGTPVYLAPEQLTGAAVTPATDVYALGILLYGLLTREIPWSAPTEAAMVAAHLIEDPAELPVLEGVTPEVATLYWRCLSRNPAVRPSARQVADLLAEAAMAPTIDAVDPTREELSTDTVEMAPAGIETTLLWNTGPPAAGGRRWQVAALLLAAGSVAIASAYFVVDVTSTNLWQFPKTPVIGAEAGRVVPPQIANPETSDPTAEPTPPSQTQPPPSQTQPPLPSRDTQASATDTPLPSTDTQPPEMDTQPPEPEPPATEPPPPGEAEPPSTDGVRVFATAAGSVVAGCQEDQAFLVSWTPADGFKVKKINAGPSTSASVELQDRSVSVVITVTCHTGEPGVAVDGRR